MNIALDIVIIIFSCLALGLGASWLVDAAARIAKRLGISELVIGLTVVAFGTSAPEFAVTITAALGGNPDISVGNIVGSNIFNIGFILGGCGVIAAVKTRAAIIWRDGSLLLAVTVLLLAFLYNLELSRLEGIILFSLLLGYLAYLSWKREPVMEEMKTVRTASRRDGPLLLLGLTFIIAGGYFLKLSAVNIAHSFGMSQWVIGVTVVAGATSIPEFVTSLVALLKKHHGISVGNLIGSNIFNTLGVLGLAGVIRPLTVESSALFSIIALISLTVIVLFFLRTAWRLSRWEGIVLLLLSLAIWTWSFIKMKPD